jgi:predicted DCC family thiol-disulfide oxidoreductase YuxK
MNDPVALPSPDDLPQAEVLIYDGQCRFCQRQAARLHRLCGSRLAFLSLHDEEVRRRYPDLTHDMLMEQMYLVDRWGRRHGGAAVIRHLSLRVPVLWPLCPLLHIPGVMAVGQWIYRIIARNRYRLAGREAPQECDNGTCAVHFGGGGPSHVERPTSNAEPGGAAKEEEEVESAESAHHRARSRGSQV